MLSFFDINNIFFTLWDYPMSYLEFFGTILNIISVWLVVKHKIWTWPIGIVAVVLFGVLFYQIQLYSDLIEQIYYFITGFYGWWAWSRYGKKDKEDKPVKISFNTIESNIKYVVVIVIATLIMGYYVGRLHIYFPNIFLEAASYPYLDAFTTVMSFVATILMIRKKIESWYLWIIVDIIGIALYFIKEVKFISILYLIFLVMASSGLYRWSKEFKKELKIKAVWEQEEA